MNVNGQIGRTAVLLLIAALLLPAMQKPDARYNEALRLVGLGRNEEALRLLKTLQREQPGNRDVMRRIGEIEFAAERWSNAREWYKKLYDADSSDVDAAYHLAVIYRETGIYKAFLLRDRDWKTSASYFSSLVAREAPIDDLYYQFALLERYRENYEHALELIEKQLAFRPLPRHMVAYYRFAEAFMHNKSPQALRRYVADRGGPLFFTAESYRFEKKLSAADSLFTLLEADSAALPRVPLYLAWSKCRYEMNDQRSAQRLYERALDSVTDETEAALMFDHCKYILSDEELSDYNKLIGVERKRDFFKKLWLQRNPMPAAEINYRLLEHIRRYIAAERDYYYDGFRLPFNNPDRLNQLVFPKVFDLNDKFNDKGLIYIRHGEPDDRAFDVEAGMPLNESWLYERRGQLQQRMIFHFIQGETQSGNNWRLSPTLPVPLLESRISWDPIYNRIITGSAVEALAHEREMVRSSREAVLVGLNTDQHSWQKTVQTIIIPFYTAVFRDASGLSRCEIYYSLSTEDLLVDSKRSAGDSAIVDFAVFDADLNSVFSQSKKVALQTIAKAEHEKDFWADQLVFIGAPDRYQFALDVRAPGDRAVGGYKFKINLSDYGGTGVLMSGLKLASEIGAAVEGSPFNKGELHVVPNPRKLFSRRQPVGVYFELYNLPAEKGKPLAFEIEYLLKLLEERESNILQALKKVFTNRQPTIANRIERSVDQPNSIEYLFLDMKKNFPGIYELQVNVYVPGIQDSLSKKINFELK